MKNCLCLTSILLLLLAFVECTRAQDEPSPDDPGHKANGNVSGLKYSIPKGFDLERSTNAKIAFLHSKDNTLIFLSVASTRPDNKALNDTAAAAASVYIPNEKDFIWKPTGVDADTASKFEVAGGGAKGLSRGKKLVQLYYKVISIKGRYITLGYIMDFGEETPAEADYAYGLDGTAGANIPAWYAIAHIIASITAEPFQDVEDKLPFNTPTN